MQERVSGSNRDFDIFKYYLDKYRDDNAMLKTVMSILSVPSSQVSVERTFSALKVVCSEKRMNLDPDMIDDIMVVRCNINMLKNINFNSFPT